jgi:hypothetical protein
MFKNVLRVMFLLILSAVFYKGDIKSFIAFFSLMSVTFWAIPEVCMFIYNQMKGDEK